jgi:hypothetical protein
LPFLYDFKALKFLQKACGLNFSGGCYNLGLMYEEGKGVQITRLLEKLERLEIILFNAFAFFIHKSKIRATTANIQITRLLEKLERLEIILWFKCWQWLLSSWIYA